MIYPQFRQTQKLSVKSKFRSPLQVMMIDYFSLSSIEDFRLREEVEQVSPDEEIGDITCSIK